MGKSWETRLLLSPVPILAYIIVSMFLQPGLQPHEIKQIKAGEKATETMPLCHSATSSARDKLTHKATEVTGKTDRG